MGVCESDVVTGKPAGVPPAITNAVRDARARAEVMAKASGARIKRVSYINDSTVNILPYRMEMKSMDFGAGNQTSIKKPA